jgi:hypothetical protein
MTGQVRNRVPGLVALALPLSLSIALSGCITRTVTAPVYLEGGIEVRLRSRISHGESVSQGFEHPAIISTQRLARILGAIEVDTGEGRDRQRTGIMAYSMLVPVSEGLSRALEEANPGQEVVVMAVRKDRRRVALFHKKYLTSFVAYVKQGDLYIHLSRINWEVPKGKEDKLPVPRIGDKEMSFRVVPVRAMQRHGAQTVAARWRDKRFSKPMGRRPSDPSQVRRRTILEDSRLPIEELDDSLTLEQTRELPEETLRLLEELQIARENGEITEDEYRRKRDDLLGIEQ